MKRPLKASCFLPAYYDLSRLETSHVCVCVCVCALLCVSLCVCVCLSVCAWPSAYVFKLHIIRRWRRFRMLPNIAYYWLLETKKKHKHIFQNYKHISLTIHGRRNIRCIYCISPNGCVCLCLGCVCMYVCVCVCLCSRISRPIYGLSVVKEEGQLGGQETIS